MFIWRNRNQTSSFLGLCDGGGGFQTVPSSLILVPFHPTCWIPEWGWLPTLRPVISSLLHTAMVFKVWILRAITLSSSPSSWGIEMSPPATTALHKHSTCFLTPMILLSHLAYSKEMVWLRCDNTGPVSACLGAFPEGQQQPRDNFKWHCVIKLVNLSGSLW